MGDNACHRQGSAIPAREGHSALGAGVDVPTVNEGHAAGGDVACVNQELPRSAAGMLYHEGNVRHAILDALLPAAIDRPAHARRFVKPAQQLASLVGGHPNVGDELTLHRRDSVCLAFAPIC